MTWGLVLCLFLLFLVGKSCSGCQVWGNGYDFSLDYFIELSFWEKLEKCKKADPLIVANCYKVDVSYSAHKAEFKKTMCKHLVGKGVLQMSAVKEAEDTAPGTDDTGLCACCTHKSVSENLEGMSPGDLLLIFCIKELENRNEEFEVQALYLCVRALELELS